MSLQASAHPIYPHSLPCGTLAVCKRSRSLCSSELASIEMQEVGAWLQIIHCSVPATQQDVSKVTGRWEWQRLCQSIIARAHCAPNTSVVRMGRKEPCRRSTPHVPITIATPH